MAILGDRAGNLILSGLIYKKKLPFYGVGIKGEKRVRKGKEIDIVRNRGEASNFAPPSSNLIVTLSNQNYFRYPRGHKNIYS